MIYSVEKLPNHVYLLYRARLSEWSAWQKRCSLQHSCFKTLRAWFQFRYPHIPNNPFIFSVVIVRILWTSNARSILAQIRIGKERETRLETLSLSYIASQEHSTRSVWRWIGITDTAATAHTFFSSLQVTSEICHKRNFSQFCVFAMGMTINKFYSRWTFGSLYSILNGYKYLLPWKWRRVGFPIQYVASSFQHFV